MSQYAVGQVVRVVKSGSISAHGLLGQIGRVIEIGIIDGKPKYAHLDIEGRLKGGIWFSEIEHACSLAKALYSNRDESDSDL